MTIEEKKLKQRKEKLSYSRLYELDDPGGSIYRENNEEEIEILRIENRLLRERLSRYETVD